MRKLIIGLALLVGACVSPSGLSGSIPDPADPKYSSANCRYIRELAMEHDFNAASRTGLTLGTKENLGKIKGVPSAKDMAAYQDRRPMIEAGVRDLCSS